MQKIRNLSVIAIVGAVAMIAAACGSSTNSGGSTSASVPSGLSVDSFDSSFSAMSQLKSLVSAGSGSVGVILPDTTSSTRYVNFDQPYLQKAFQQAGYSSSQFKIDNAQGDAAKELSLAQGDITQGAKVLIFDPLDSNTGAQIQQYAQSHGVKTISYDRATFTGQNVYYVSFDNEKVGELIGQGFLDCASSWGISNAKVFELDGGQNSDPNAVSFAQGYNNIIWGKKDGNVPDGTTNSHGMTLLHEQITPDWKNDQGQAIFQNQFTAHRDINATVEANDGLGNAVINVLKSNNVPAKKIPTTGQDATLQGMVNVLQGYQCGSVYKAVYLEAQDAVAIATVLRAKLTPPSALLNSTTSPPANVTGSTQPASLLKPQWVTSSNMKDTVIKDQFVDKSALCTQAGASACSAAGIS